MEVVYIITNIILFFCFILFVKNFLPSYMVEKGKNLATKEDIEVITRKTEAVQKEFQEGFELFSSDVRFKYDFYFRQYSELYSKLYGIIIQSEYARYFIKINADTEVPFDEAPFLQVSRTHKVKRWIKWGSKEPTEIKEEEEEIDTPLSDFSKEYLCQYIIEKAEYATQKLLKIAVAYRFANFYYGGKPNNKNISCKESANAEEFRLIREMVCCIVSEYNFFRKELKMEYNEEELKTGILQL